VEEKRSGFDHPELPVVVQGALTPMRWGLIPVWVKTREEALEIQNHTLNARGESVFEKPSFKDAIHNRRCVIPVEAFYEWQHVGKEKIPFLIKPSTEPLFSLAGIWEVWKSPQTATPVKTFSILTCVANSLMAEIHNSARRMPVILSLEAACEWIEPGLPVPRIRELAAPCPEEWLVAERIAV
jgi:putative SOS response-associated peptidase YedK